MSWLARSIANSLRIDDDDDENQPLPPANFPATSPENDDLEEREGGPDRHGTMKEDFTEFRETLTRQLRGVANFLAPPPESDHRVISEWNRSESPDPSVSGDDHDDSSVYARISAAPSDDHSEIGVFINRVVAENYQGSSSFNSFGLQNIDYVVDEEDAYDDNDDDDVEDWINQAAGLTDEVLTFAGNIAHHPETWLDFPVEDDEDLDDFPMSESQRRHAQAIEHLTPRLAALRIELCPAHMSEGFFWKVYFVLLHSRLNKHDAELLSTPEVVEARAKWMQELHKRDKKESEQYHVGRYPRQSADLDEDFTPRSLQNEHSETLSSWTFPSEAATSSTTAEADSDYEKQLGTEMQFTNKSNNMNEEKPLAHTGDKNTGTAPVSKRLVLNFDDDDDDWPEDDCLGQNATIIPVGMEDEVSFSDLEDDDCCIPVKSKPEVRV